MNNDEQNGKAHREEVCPGKKDKLNPLALQAEIEKKNAPEMWRSLEELAGNPEVREMMHREFPKGASEWIDAVSRRGFLKLMGSSLALAGMTACTRQPLEPIVPYVRQPEGLIPGKAMSYATAFTLGGYAAPLLVTSREFRPIKIEGNPEHQASLGGTDIFAQASILDLYDPDRSQNVLYKGEIATWGSFADQLRGPLNSQKTLQGAGIRILSRAFSSPTLLDQKQQFEKNFPLAKWHVYEPVNRDNVYAGAQIAFGQPVETVYKLDAADVIVSLDADFLYGGFPGMTRYARDFAKRRDPESEKMSRFYAIESAPTSTGAKADHRLPVRASEVEGIARALQGGAGLSGEAAKFVQALLGELQAAHGSSVVIPGEHQPPVVHALAHALNQQLGNVGKTVFYTDPVLATTESQIDSIRDLVADMRGGKVDLLVILGGNPAFDAPADLAFADALENSKIPVRVHLGLRNNETAELCHWHISEAHYLEQWGDTRAYDGTISIVQPLIAPLYTSHSASELVSLVNGQADTPGFELVQNYWKSKHSGADFDTFWRRSVHDGFVAGTTYQSKQVSLKAQENQASAQAGSSQDGGIEINFRRDPSIYDGRFANNAWLQELPKPLTKMTWDNPLLMGPRMADRLQVKSMDMVKVELNGKSLDLPVWIQAGHPDHSVTVYFGYGRRRSGRAGNAAGFDVYQLRYSATPDLASGKVTKTSGHYLLSTTQGYQTMDVGTAVGEDHREIVRAATLKDFKDKNFSPEAPEPEETMFNNPPYDYAAQPYVWGMTIDHNACVGCNNCIVACQSENNIAVVGKEQVNRGRHMHWLRVDVYYQGDRDNPRAYFQPVPCMQCENAPCEVVCPVGATTHSTEGLNDMIYNRCVGTRYCSNNCPYKVRRFNFLLFQDWETPQLKMMRNPDVTVRSRGVMEKCTYCVQRITHARIAAEEATTEQAKIDSIANLQTACQQSCPANAIVFGNINDPNSAVSKLKAKSRNYAVLDDLNTRPRTTYLGAVRNPNPELEGSST
jgi:molybdopterin-containing oxidoreductase family iron-sulfur binding subunit